MNLLGFSRVFAVALLLCLTMRAQRAEPDFQPKFPRTMSWSAYNLGTTGYNQAVAIGKALKDNYNVNLRVLPGKNDVSRLLPLSLCQGILGQGPWPAPRFIFLGLRGGQTYRLAVRQ